MAFIPAERRNKIHETIRTQGSVRVPILSELWAVSELTIRRDLEPLEQAGILERSPGGAIYSHRMRQKPL